MTKKKNYIIKPRRKRMKTKNHNITLNFNQHKLNMIFNKQKTKIFIKDVIQSRLFECAIVKLGIHKNRVCFSLTQFGKKLFEE